LAELNYKSSLLENTKSLSFFRAMERRAIVVLTVLAVVSCVSSRWLPTRSQDDRLDKLREMLKEVIIRNW